MFSTEGLPGIGVGGWWAPGLLNGQQDSSAIDNGKKEEKRVRKKEKGREKDEKENGERARRNQK